MLDNIGLQLNEVSETEFSMITQRMGNRKPVNADKIQFKWESLFVQYFPNEKKLTLKNSVHKFYNGLLGGEDIGFSNHNDFDRWNLFTAAEYMTEVFERPFSDFKVFSKFEYGLNIDTGVYKPFEIINRYKACIRNAANEFYTMPPNTGKPYCRSCFFTDYRVKAYDKSMQASFIGKNILRYEIALQGLVMLRRVVKIPEITLLDIISPDVWDVLFGNMIDIYDDILKIPLGIPCSSDDLLSFHRYSDVLINADLKKLLSTSEYQALHNKDKKIFDRWNRDENNVHNVIRHRMTEKYSLLKISDVDFTSLN